MLALGAEGGRTEMSRPSETKGCFSRAGCSISSYSAFCAPPIASEVIGVGKRVVRAGAHARSTPGGPEQQARRDLDFFINRHEHDPLHKFVL